MEAGGPTGTKTSKKKMEVVETTKAPSAIGPYSQAIKTQNLVFTSGQISLKSETNQLVEGDITAQTRQVLENVKTVLEAAGTSMEKVVKVTVYLADMNDFAKMNEVYAEYFTKNKPARSTVQVAKLPKNVKVEIDAIAEA